jgi:hypothetical protein
MKNDLETIYCALLKQIGKVGDRATVVQIISEHSCILDNNTYLPYINKVVKVKRNTILTPIFLRCTLSVQINGANKDWLFLQESNIFNSGLGVFAARVFKNKEFVSLYMGYREEVPTSVTYTYRKINASIQTTGSYEAYGYSCPEEYWFAHRIQHGSGSRVNVRGGENYVIRATREINIGEEIYMDYLRDVKCVECNNEKMCCDIWLNKERCCSMCGKYSSYGKSCGYCSAYICFECYDSFQII